MSLIDLVQGHSVSLRALKIPALLVSTKSSLACEMQYAQRYQRRLAAKGSSWQASGNPADTLSSGRQASQAVTNLDVAVSTSYASGVYKHLLGCGHLCIADFLF